MALFGKKKPAATSAPQPNPEDYIQVMGGDADETGVEEADSGQVIDFDAIAQDLNAKDDDSTMDAFLGRNSVVEAEAPADTSHVAPNISGATNLDDEIDFGTHFDAGAPVVPVTTVATNADMFDAAPDFGNAPNIEPVMQAPGVQAPEVPTRAPRMNHTAPILTSDLAASGSAPAMKKSLPLPMLLGAAGLLAALGVVGYLVFGGASKPEASAPVIAARPAMPSGAVPASGGPSNAMPGGAMPSGAMPSGAMPSGAVAAPGGPSGAVNQGIAVDGVPIAPGLVVRQAPIGAVAPATALGTAPALPLSAAPDMTPAMKAKLKALWSKGANAKHSGKFAEARAAWTEMQKLRPGNAEVQAAIDKLPAA